MRTIRFNLLTFFPTKLWQYHAMKHEHTYNYDSYHQFCYCFNEIHLKAYLTCCSALLNEKKKRRKQPTTPVTTFLSSVNLLRAEVFQLCGTWLTKIRSEKNIDKKTLPSPQKCEFMCTNRFFFFKLCEDCWHWSMCYLTENHFKTFLFCSFEMESFLVSITFSSRFRIMDEKNRVERGKKIQFVNRK